MSAKGTKPRRTNKTRKAYFMNVDTISTKNKEKKLNKHMKKHPNDLQSLEQKKSDMTRKKPLTWWEKLHAKYVEMRNKRNDNIK